MAGRVETYVHSDITTQNKGGCIVEVTCKTDFAARTQKFVDFARKVAKFCYGAGNRCWDHVILMFPELEEERKTLSQKLGEEVLVQDIYIIKLS